MFRRARHREVLAQVDVRARKIVAEVGDAVERGHAADVASARAREEVVIAAIGVDHHAGVQHVAIGSQPRRGGRVEALFDRRDVLVIAGADLHVEEASGRLDIEPRPRRERDVAGHVEAFAHVTGAVAHVRVRADAVEVLLRETLLAHARADDDGAPAEGRGEPADLEGVVAADGDIASVVTRIAPFITGCCQVEPNATPLPLETVPMRGVQPSRVPLKRESHLCAAEKRAGVCVPVLVVSAAPGLPVVTVGFSARVDARSSASSVASGGVGSSHEGAGFGSTLVCASAFRRRHAAGDADTGDGEVTSFHGASPFLRDSRDVLNSLRAGTCRTRAQL